MAGAMMTYPCGLLWVSDACTRRFIVLCRTASGIASDAVSSTLSFFCSVRGICCPGDGHASRVEQPSHCWEARVLRSGGMEFSEGRQWHDWHIQVHVEKLMDFLSWAEVAKSIVVS